MGREGAQQKNHGLCRLANHFPSVRAMRAWIYRFVELVHELHDRRDSRIQVKPLFDVASHPHDRLMRLAAESHLALVPLFVSFNRRSGAERIFLVLDETPHPLEKSPRSFQTLIGPVDFLFRRRLEEHIEPHGVGPVFVDEHFRVDDIALVLRHLRAVFDDHAL